MHQDYGEKVPKQVMHSVNVYRIYAYRSFAFRSAAYCILHSHLTCNRFSQGTSQTTEFRGLSYGPPIGLSQSLVYGPSGDSLESQAATRSITSGESLELLEGTVIQVSEFF